jgi:hypothetical protein
MFAEQKADGEAGDDGGECGDGEAGDGEDGDGEDGDGECGDDDGDDGNKNDQEKYDFNLANRPDQLGLQFMTIVYDHSL